MIRQLQKIFNNKRSLYLSVALVLTALSVALNISYSMFTAKASEAVANIKISNMSYAITVNGILNKIIEVPANNITIVDVGITALNELDSKYELIYKVCTSSTCDSYMDNPLGFSIKYSSETFNEVTGLISANGTKTVRIAITNNTANIIYIELDINAGFAYNELELVTSITSEYEEVIDPQINCEDVANQNLLYCQILAQGGGASVIAIKDAPDFATSATSLDTGVYAMEDEYGTSYYFRGEKTLLSNNIIFGGHQWKILRINGDGTIRLIYNGICANNECEIDREGVSTQINYADWWNVTYNNDNKYVGYMYGGANGDSSASREQATINETSTNAKTLLDNWYLDNISGKPFENQVADNLFCSDRQLANEVGGPPTGVGYSNSDTYYAAQYRLDVNRTPTLKCELKNDRFTVSDTTVGNGDLTYPIGLITADEASVAGVVNGISNSLHFLYSSQWFWTFTPHSVAWGGTAFVWSIGAGGLRYDQVADISGLRPVINLTSETIVTGSGTQLDPYKVIL